MGSHPKSKSCLQFIPASKEKISFLRKVSLGILTMPQGGPTQNKYNSIFGDFLSVLLCLGIFSYWVFCLSILIFIFMFLGML